MTADEFNELADGSWKYEIERLTAELDKARTTIARMNSMESEHCADLAKELVECRKLLNWISLQGEEYSQCVLMDQPGDGDHYVRGMNCGGQASTWIEALRIAVEGDAK